MTYLEELYNSKYRDKTDKGTVHSYIPLYGKWLDDRRKQIVSVLEIGVDKGGSLLMWQEYFPFATIHGIDLRDCPVVKGVERIFMHVMNVTDIGAIDRSFASPFELFDVIIDDGSHQICEQLFAISALWNHLVGGGLYAIEDIQRPEHMQAFRGFMSTNNQPSVTFGTVTTGPSNILYSTGNYLGMTMRYPPEPPYYDNSAAGRHDDRMIAIWK